MRTAKLASALLFLLITIFVSPRVFAQTPKDEDNVQTMLYLPLLGNAGRQNMASTSIQPAIPVLEEWPTFYSAELHITFAYPPGWKVELPKNWGPATTPKDQPKEYNTPADTHPEGYLISLYPPEGQQGFEHNMIELTVQSYEIAKGESLVDWHKKMTEMWDALGDIYKPGTVHTENITTFALQTARAPEQVLHIARTIEGYGRGNETVWLTKGRLVYVVNSATYSKEMEEVLRQLTISIQFDADAPESLNDLYKVDLYRPAIQETRGLLNKLKAEVEPCDIVCKDAKASHDLGIEPDAGPIDFRLHCKVASPF